MKGIKNKFSYRIYYEKIWNILFFQKFLEHIA